MTPILAVVEGHHIAAVLGLLDVGDQHMGQVDPVGLLRHAGRRVCTPTSEAPLRAVPLETACRNCVSPVSSLSLTCTCPETGMGQKDVPPAPAGTGRSDAKLNDWTRTLHDVRCPASRRDRGDVQVKVVGMSAVERPPTAAWNCALLAGAFWVRSQLKVEVGVSDPSLLIPLVASWIAP